MSLRVTEFDGSKLLTDEYAISIYLGDALENEDAAGVVDAMKKIVSAKGGPALVADSTRLSESTILDALSDSPKFTSLLALMRGLGVKLTTSALADAHRENMSQYGTPFAIDRVAS
jgi:probable addiction module antidote protein